MTPAEDKALEILSNVCNVPREKLVPEAGLIQDLDIDSVVTLDLLMELEESFGIDIPEVKAAEMQTVGDILAYVREHVPA